MGMVRDGRYVNVVRDWMSCVGRSVDNGIVNVVEVSRVGRGW